MSKAVPPGVFGYWLNDRIEKSGKSMKQISKETGIKDATMRLHIRGMTYPTIPTLAKYSEYFDEDPRYLYDLVIVDARKEVRAHVLAEQMDG